MQQRGSIDIHDTREITYSWHCKTSLQELIKAVFKLLFEADLILSCPKDQENRKIV